MCKCWRRSQICIPLSRTGLGAGAQSLGLNKKPRQFYIVLLSYSETLVWELNLQLHWRVWYESDERRTNYSCCVKKNIGKKIILLIYIKSIWYFKVVQITSKIVDVWLKLSGVSTIILLIIEESNEMEASIFLKRIKSILFLYRLLE